MMYVEPIYTCKHSITPVFGQYTATVDTELTALGQ